MYLSLGLYTTLPILLITLHNYMNIYWALSCSCHSACYALYCRTHTGNIRAEDGWLQVVVVVQWQGDHRAPSAVILLVSWYSRDYPLA